MQVGGAVTACSSAPAAAAELRWLHSHPSLRIMHLWIDHSSIVSTLHELHAAAPQAWQARLSSALVSASYSLLRLPHSMLRFGRIEFSPPTSEDDTPVPGALPLGLLLRAPSMTLDLEKCAAKVLLLDAPEAEAEPVDWQAALLGALEAAGVGELVVVGAAGAALAWAGAVGGAAGAPCPLAAAGFEAVDLGPWQLYAGRRDPPSGFAAVVPVAARPPAGLLEFCEAPGGAAEARALFDACRRRCGLAGEQRWRLWCWKEGAISGGAQARCANSNHRPERSPLSSCSLLRSPAAPPHAACCRRLPGGRALQAAAGLGHRHAFPPAVPRAV